MIRDYLQFVLLTGCQKSEAITLNWKDVLLLNNSFVIVDPKNRNPIELPLSDYLVNLMNQRRKETKGEYVFPANSKSGHLTEPKKQLYAVTEQRGIKFTLHNLRRTFITQAESLDISQYVLKGLVNHKVSLNDVTAGYVQLTCERLREPMQRITDYILNEAGTLKIKWFFMDGLKLALTTIDSNT